MPWLVCDDRVLASLEIIDSISGRMRGLLGRSSLEGAVMLIPAKSVHTVGMKFAIDAIYCRRGEPSHADDRSERWEVLSTETLKPHRVGRPRSRSRGVIEMRAGSCDRLDIGAGNTLTIRFEDQP